MTEHCIDDHLLCHYRQLLDAEDEAFSEMEHDFEDGDGDKFVRDRQQWLRAMRLRYEYLGQCGFTDFPELTSAQARR